jgi:RNA polymerase sigma-70 factor (ECF subfamily)
VVNVELIEAAQNGDREALIKILRTIERDAYKTAYYMLGNRQDAQDVTQETLLRIARNIKNYENKALFQTWVYRIVHNLCIDCLRKHKDTVSLEGQALHIPAKESVEQEVVRKQEHRDLVTAIQTLENPYRSIVVLRFIQQRSYEEIAASLEIPLNTVKSYLFRAKNQLQKALYEQEKGGGQG